MAAAAVLLLTSQATYFADEGYHLLAARRVLSGDRPYADFFYQQGPFYPYVLGAWMQLAGDTWRSAHVLSALLAVATAWIIAGVFRSGAGTPVSGVLAPALAVLFVGLNGLVVRFGTLAMPYVVSTFLLALAYRCVVRAGATPGPLPAGLAGVFAGAGAWSSLLAAAAVPVLGLWLARPAQAGNRTKRLLTFLAGVLLVSLPVAWIGARSPSLAWFDMVTYHLEFGRGWGAGGADYPLRRDLLTLLGLAYLGEGILLVPLAAVGVAAAARRYAAIDPLWRSAAVLAAAMALVLFATAALARPTFPFYFLMAWPFLAVGATVGACLTVSERRITPALALWLLVVVFGLDLVRPARAWLHAPSRWQELEEIGRRITEQVPVQSTVLSDERLYFVTGRVPEASLDNVSLLPAWVVARGHMLSVPALVERLKNGSVRTVVFEDGDTTFATLFEICRTRARIREFHVVSDCRRGR